MELALKHGAMAQVLVEAGLRTRFMDLADMFGEMVASMMGIGRKIKWMDTGS